MRIENIRKSDQGEYICQAENRFGKVKVSASLKVLSNPNSLHSNFEENEIDDSSHGQHKSPSFSDDQDRAIFDSLLPVTEHPADESSNQMRYLTKQQGSQVQLECEAMNQVSSGSPDILYWTKDRQVIRHNPRIAQMGNGTLMVYNMSQSDEGIYECVAKRGRERRTTRTQLSIIPLLENNVPQIHDDQEPITISNTDRFHYNTDTNTDSNNEVMAALEEVSEKVDKAIEETINKMMSHNATKTDAIKALRYPVNVNDRLVQFLNNNILYFYSNRAKLSRSLKLMFPLLHQKGKLPEAMKFMKGP